jgi:multidrug transporter EmrE-like cation transporter
MRQPVRRLRYTVGGVFMRKAEGFAHALPTVMVFPCFGTGAALQTLAMKRSEVSINYILVLGLEAALALPAGSGPAARATRFWAAGAP